MSINTKRKENSISCNDFRVNAISLQKYTTTLRGQIIKQIAMLKHRVPQFKSKNFLIIFLKENKFYTNKIKGE
ncbi:hypothetical protein [Clostridium chromiireducens]|uniref:hypothetical protein n=1 Tax=Clostridium chromiireducens TaxID=225345 RepID=UPI0009A50183|nr:hypothetical protein [Clostridium chromiireducens]